jgi:hypothetical protein
VTYFPALCARAAPTPRFAICQPVPAGKCARHAELQRAAEAIIFIQHFYGHNWLYTNTTTHTCFLTYIAAHKIAGT